MSDKREVRLIDSNALCEGLVSNHPVVIAAKCAPVITLNTLRDAIYEDAVKHGLWGRHYGPAYCAELIHDEASELDLAAMDWERDDNYDSEFCEELADVIITALSVAGNLGIDIDAAVRGKMEINKSRPWKHGKDEKK